MMMCADMLKDKKKKIEHVLIETLLIMIIYIFLLKLDTFNVLMIIILICYKWKIEYLLKQHTEGKSGTNNVKRFPFCWVLSIYNKVYEIYFIIYL